MAGDRNLRDLLLKLRDNMAELVPLIDEMHALKVGLDLEFMEKLRELSLLSDSVNLAIAQNFCEGCGATPVWARETQFSGKTLFCDKCAREQPEFRVVEKYGSYFWKELKPGE